MKASFSERDPTVAFSLWPATQYSSATRDRECALQEGRERGRSDTDGAYVRDRLMGFRHRLLKARSAEGTASLDDRVCLALDLHLRAASSIHLRPSQRIPYRTSRLVRLRQSVLTTAGPFGSALPSTLWARPPPDCPVLCRPPSRRIVTVTLQTIARERDASPGPRRPPRRQSRGRARAFVAPSAGTLAICP